MKTFSEFTFEATSVAKGHLKDKKLKQKDFDLIKTLDPTQSKYVDWLAIRVVNDGLNIETKQKEIFNALTRFEHLTSRKVLKGNDADISKIKTFAELEQLVKGLLSKEEVENQNLLNGVLIGVNKNEYSVVHDDERSIIYAIYTHRASCIVGIDSGWCTAMKTNSSYFDNYNADQTSFLYIIDKKVKSSGHGSEKGKGGGVDYSKDHSYDMFAVHKKMNGKITVTDKADIDNRIEWGEIKKIYKISDKIWGSYKNSHRKEFLPLDQIKTKEDVINNLIITGIILYEDDVRVNSDLSVDADSITISEVSGNIPVQFNEVNNFYCNEIDLVSLKGSPKIVNGDFDCSYNELISLEWAPKIVKGKFNCSNNKLTSLKGLSLEIDRGLDCRFNSVQFTEEEINKISQVYGEIKL